MPTRRRLARIFGYSSIALTIALGVAFALTLLGTFYFAALRTAMDVPMALTFWAYTLLTPIVSALALWLGQENERLVLTVKLLAALWLAIFLLLSSMHLAG